MSTRKLESKEYMRRVEMAKHLSISPRHLSRLVRDGVVPCIRLGHKCVLFEPEKVRKALLKFEQIEVGR